MADATDGLLIAKSTPATAAEAKAATRPAPRPGSVLQKAPTKDRGRESMAEAVDTVAPGRTPWVG